MADFPSAIESADGGGMGQEKDRAVARTEPEATTEREEVAIRRRRALERLGKIAVYTTPLVIGLLSSDAWSESG